MCSKNGFAIIVSGIPANWDQQSIMVISRLEIIVMGVHDGKLYYLVAEYVLVPLKRRERVQK